MHSTFISLTLNALFSTVLRRAKLRTVPARPWIPPTQHPIETTTLASSTTNSNISVDPTTVASTTVEISTTPPATAPATLPATAESTALDEHSRKLPDSAEKINGDGVQHGDSEPINASNPSPATEAMPAIDKVMQPQPADGDIKEMAHEPDTEPSALPIDDVHAETSAPAGSTEA